MNDPSQPVKFRHKSSTLFRLYLFSDLVHCSQVTYLACSIQLWNCQNVTSLWGTSYLLMCCSVLKSNAYFLVAPTWSDFKEKLFFCGWEASLHRPERICSLYHTQEHSVQRNGSQLVCPQGPHCFLLIHSSHTGSINIYSIYETEVKTTFLKKYFKIPNN